MAATPHRALCPVLQYHTPAAASWVIRQCGRHRVYLLHLGLALLVVYLLLACAQAQSSQLRVQYGKASWYGETFHGRRTASGEIYDMSKLTAAHPQAPLGSHAIVTNMDTGHAVRVRINDRGPFAQDRIIDVSHAAARQLGMLEAGVTRVKVEFLPDTARAATFMVQAGAYRQQKNAAHVQRLLVAHYPTAHVTQSSQDGHLYRIHLGPYATRTKAERVARGVQALGYTSTVVPLP
jgi:rare lipoprotein A